VLQAFDLLLLHLPISQSEWIDQSFILFTTIAIGLDIPEETRITTLDKAGRELNERGVEGLSEPATDAVLAVR
jgi:hypothetical protein